MHRCAIAIFGSYSRACRHDRSDSVNQNEWICDMPCRKNWRACSDEVVTGKSFVVPIPGSSFAGSSGCAPGGTAHKSGSFTGCACFPFASANDDKPVRTMTNTVVDRTLCIARQVCGCRCTAAIGFPTTECVFYTIPQTPPGRGC